MILLGGWLLMVPEVTESPPGEFRINASKNVRAWRQILAFDTAQQCEQAHYVSIKDIGEKQKRRPTDSPEKRVKPLDPVTASFGTYDEASRFADGLSRCVPAEYIYPPTEPAKGVSSGRSP